MGKTVYGLYDNTQGLLDTCEAECSDDAWYQFGECWDVEYEEYFIEEIYED